MSDLPAGRELDLFILRDVFGHALLTQQEMRAEAYLVWESQPGCIVFLKGFTARYQSGDLAFEQHVPSYSTDIAAAFQVVEKMREHGFYARIDYEDITSAGCDFWSESLPAMRYYRTAPTAPHAICLAALAACLDPTHEPEAPSNEGDDGSRHAPHDR